MKTIYRAITPRQHWHPQQDINATLIAERAGARVRVTVRFDTAYASQCRGAVAVLADREFAPLLTLHTHEIPFVATYHGMEPEERGNLLRDGDAFERRICASLDDLAERGFDILGILGTGPDDPARRLIATLADVMADIERTEVSRSMYVGGPEDDGGDQPPTGDTYNTLWSAVIEACNTVCPGLFRAELAKHMKPEFREGGNNG